MCKLLVGNKYHNIPRLYLIIYQHLLGVESLNGRELLPLSINKNTLKIYISAPVGDVRRPGDEGPAEASSPALTACGQA